MSSSKGITEAISDAPDGYNLHTLKAISGLVAGSIVVSYIFSKYYRNPVQSTIDWLLGRSSPKKSRRSRKARNQRKKQSRQRQIEQENLDEEESIQEEKYNDKNAMSYISEENTVDEESSVCEDLLIPSPNDDCSSISYYSKRPKMYLNSRDELVEENFNPEEEEESAVNFYVKPSKTSVRRKLYSRREAEASKFIQTLDKAITTFKKNKMKNPGAFEPPRYSTKQSRRNNAEIKSRKFEKEDYKEPSSLNDKFRSELQQLSPKARKEKLRNLDEKSVRLHDSDVDKNEKSHFDKESTIASEIPIRRGAKKFVPDSKQLKSKNDYIFFELLSAYTENFVDKQGTKSK